MAVTFNGSIPPFAQGNSAHAAVVILNPTPGRTDSPFNRPNHLSIPSSTPDRSTTPQSQQRRLTPQDPSHVTIVQAPVGFDWNSPPPMFAPSQPTRQPTPQQTPQQPPPQRNIHIAGVFSEPSPILDYLLLGSDESARDYERIRPLGVTHVLNMARECPNHFEGRFLYLRADFQDFAFEDMMDFLPRGIRFIEDARTGKPAQGSKRKHGVVLVHCNQGRSRSATMVIAYIMWKLGQNLADAQAVVQAQRPHIETYNFGHHLREFEKLLDDCAHFVMAKNCEINGLPFEPQPITEIFAQRRPRPPAFPPPAAPSNANANANSYASAFDSRPPPVVPDFEHRPPPVNPSAAHEADGFDFSAFGFHQGGAPEIPNYGYEQPPAQVPHYSQPPAHAPHYSQPFNVQAEQAFDMSAFGMGSGSGAHQSLGAQVDEMANFGFNQANFDQFLYNVAQPPPALTLPAFKKKTPANPSASSSTSASPPAQEVIVITPMQPPEEEAAPSSPPSKSPRKDTLKDKPSTTNTTSTSSSSTSTAAPLLPEKPTLLVTPDLPLRPLSITPRAAAATPSDMPTPKGEVRVTPALPPVQIVERTTPHASPRRTPMHPRVGVDVVQPPKQCCIIS